MGELAQEKKERAEKSAIRAAAAKQREERRGKQELKDLLTKTGVAMTMDKVELVQQLIREPCAALQAVPAEPPELADSVVLKLQRLGLSQQHISLAAAGVTPGAGVDEALDWLCLHVDAAELPAKLRGQHRLGVTVVRTADAAADNPAVDDPSVQLVTQFGYSVADAVTALKLFDDSAAAAWSALFSRATGAHIGTAALSDAVLTDTEDDDGAPGNADSDWHDELTVMTSMYEDDVVHARPHSLLLRLPLSRRLQDQYAHQSAAGQAPAPLEVLVVMWPGAVYPDEPPLFGMRCESLPGPVRVALTAQAAAHLREHALGAPMLHELHDCLSSILSDSAAPLLAAARLRFSNLMAPQLAVASEDTPSSVVSGGKAPGKKARRNEKRSRSAAQLAAEAQELLAMRQRAENGSEMRAMRDTRRALPAFAQRAEVLQAVAHHRAVVIAGATGCGKSTQVRMRSLQTLRPCGAFSADATGLISCSGVCRCHSTFWRRP